MKKYLYSFLCGTITGAVVFFFKLIARKAEELSRLLFSLAKGSLLFALLLFVVVGILIFLSSFLQKKIPECKGGGISKSKNIIENSSELRSFRTLIGTFAGSLISFFSSVGVGTEGPSVLMGTSVGSLFSKKAEERKCIMISGASAGFAAATGAPLSALFFSSEEIHKRFELPLIFVSSFAVLSSTLTNLLLCRIFSLNSKLFLVEIYNSFCWKQISGLFFLSVTVAICVFVFEAFLKAIKKINFSVFKFPLIFVLSALFALFFDSAVYSGHKLTESVFEGEFTLRLLFVVLILRILLLVLVKKTHITGGVFLPCLAIGALIGAISANLLMPIGFEESLFINLTLLGMCAFIGSVMKAPLMACVFYIELTGDLQSALYVFIVVFLTYALTEATENLLA